MNATQIEYTHLDGFITALRKERHGRTHFRVRLGGGKATFVTANAATRGVGLHGRITGPVKNHADYQVGIGKSNQVLISINLEDPTGTYTLEQAYADITKAIKTMMKRPSKKPDFSEGRDTSRLDGFYLKSTGANKVGKKGKQTLALAISGGHISQDFHDHCIREGFTMEQF